MLSWVNSPNPIAAPSKPKRNTKSNAANGSTNTAIGGSGKDPLAEFRSLFGLSVGEAREFYRRGEAEGEAGGAAAVRLELNGRKAAFIKAVLTVAPSLGMTHGNPGMQGEVSSEQAE